MRKLKHTYQEGAVLSVYAFVAVAFLSLIILVMSEQVSSSIRVSGQAYAEKQAYWNARSGIEIAAGFVQDFDDLIFNEDSGWSGEGEKALGEITISSEWTGEDPIAHYTFNEDINDHSGNNDCTVAGGAEEYTVDRFCAPNRALSLDGLNDYFTADGVAMAISGTDHTVSAWIKTQDNLGAIISFNHRTDLKEKRLIYSTDRNFCFRVEGVVGCIGGDEYIDDNEWHHLAAVFKQVDQTITLYVDGVKDRPAYTLLDALTIDVLDWFTIGQDLSEVDGIGSLYIGLLDDVRIYDTALEASEIEAIASPHYATSRGDFFEAVRSKEKNSELKNN